MMHSRSERMGRPQGIGLLRDARGLYAEIDMEVAPARVRAR